MRRFGSTISSGERVPDVLRRDQSDLAKEDSGRGRRRTGAQLANKFLTFRDRRTSPFDDMHGEFLGEDVSSCLEPSSSWTVNRPLPVTPWRYSQKVPKQRRFSAGRRASTRKRNGRSPRNGERARWLPDRDVIEMLKTTGVYEERPCRTLANVRTMADEVMDRLRPVEQLCLGCGLLGVVPDQIEKITLSIRNGRPTATATFAPYVDFCLRVELFFHLAVDKSRMAAVQRMDLCYLFYLPFCQFFVSRIGSTRGPLRFSCEQIRSSSLVKTSRRHSGH